MSPTAVTRFDIVLVYYASNTDLQMMKDYVQYFKLTPIIVFFGELIISGAKGFNALSFKFSEHETLRQHMETRYR
jgi:hypothetical protein